LPLNDLGSDGLSEWLVTRLLPQGPLSSQSWSQK
jgi:hypothetical protein